MYGLIGLSACLAICVSLAIWDDPSAPDVLVWAGIISGFLSALYLAPSAIGGAGLLLGKAWGRVAILGVSLLLLLAVPVGTLLGAMSLWVLFRSRPPPAPRAPRQGEPTGSGLSGVPAMVVAAAGVAAGFIVMIGAGFRLHDQAAPAVIDAAFYPAILVLTATATMGVMALRGAGDGLSFQDRARIRRQHQASMAAHRDRLAALAADPARARYVPLIEQGQSWTDAQIAYDQDPDARVTCEHLQPIEGAMREAGLFIQPFGDSYARVQALIDPAELSRLYPDPQVTYREFCLGERSPDDYPMAQITCAEHQSVIDATPPREAGPDTPTFPAGWRT